MKVAIIKYNAGNVKSVSFELKRLGVDYICTHDIDEIKSADKVIFPGVGEASTTMKYLCDKNLDRLIPALKQPVLGICLGMQLLCSRSEENDTRCLGVFDESVIKLRPQDKIKVPHVGWNNIQIASDWLNPQLQNQYVYFVHSYYVPISLSTSATTRYITPFSAAMRKQNFFGVQFHPEKSAAAGELVLKSFLQQ